MPPQVIRVALRYPDPLSLYIDFSVVLVIGVIGGESYGIEYKCVVEDALVAQQAGAEEGTQEDGVEELFHGGVSVAFQTNMEQWTGQDLYKTTI